MTLVLKSNNTAVNAISDKHGLLAATDWKLMLDFENEDYFSQQNGVKSVVDINSCLESANENAFIYDKNNNYKVVPKNSLRMSLNQKKDAFGLCEEIGFTELYFPGTAPFSKTITLYRGANVGPYIVRAKGAGQVKVSGTDIKSLSNSTVTQENAASLYSVGVESTPTLNLTIDGEITHLSVIAVGLENNVSLNNNFAESKLSTWLFKSTITKFKSQQLSEVLANKKDFTILMQCIDNDYLNVPSSSLGVYKPLLELINLSNHISIIKRKNAGAEELAVRLFKDSTETVLIMSGTKRSSVIAITSGADGVKIAMDGKVSNASGVMSGFTVADALIGSSNQWLSSGLMKAEGVFTKLAIYDRQLSSEELEKATLSFQ